MIKGYPDKEFRDDRINTLKLMLDTLKDQGEALNREVAKINAELKVLELLELLESEVTQ